MNEAVIAILGIAFKEYSQLKGDPNFDMMLLTSILSYEGFPKNTDEISYGNNWIPYSYTAPVSIDLDKNLTHLREQFKPIVASMKLLGEEVLMDQMMQHNAEEMNQQKYNKH